MHEKYLKIVIQKYRVVLFLVYFEKVVYHKKSRIVNKFSVSDNKTYVSVIILMDVLKFPHGSIGILDGILDKEVTVLNNVSDHELTFFF